jgi:hypothetical protein
MPLKVSVLLLLDVPLLQQHVLPLYMSVLQQPVLPLDPRIFKRMEPRNRFQGMNSASLCSQAGRYDNPIPTRCLAPIDFLKIPESET